MRRSWMIVMALLLVASFASPAAANPPVRNVEGTMTGPGGFRFTSCGGIITEIGSGTFEATTLGRGTYTFDVCITGTSPLTFSGTATFTTRNGARLDGVIGGSGTGPRFPVTIVGGTKQFAHATGSLVLGEFVQSDQHNCNPRVMICLDWTDTGPITGTLQRGGHR
jgi:hypothetical protein